MVESVLTRTTKDCSIQLTSAQRIRFVIATLGWSTWPIPGQMEDTWPQANLPPGCSLTLHQSSKAAVLIGNNGVWGLGGNIGLWISWMRKVPSSMFLSLSSVEVCDRNLIILKSKELFSRLWMAFLFWPVNQIATKQEQNESED